MARRILLGAWLALGATIGSAAGGAIAGVPGAAVAESPGAASFSGSQAAEIVPGPGGYVRVTEIGHPPLGMSGPAARSIARKNALARARESLLRTILSLRARDGRKVGEILRQNPEHKPGLRAVLDGATTAGVELANNAVEITLTIRMDGDLGLGQYLDSLQTPAGRGP